MEELSKLAAELLSSGQVKVVIGYEEAPRGKGVRPAFITDPAQTGRLVFDGRCTHNLAVYLQKKRKHIRAMGKPAVVVKGCDARAMAGLLREAQIAREDVVLIGVRCPGVWEDSLADKPVVSESCAGCDCTLPELTDHLVGPEMPQPTAQDRQAERVAKLEALSHEDRWRFWLDHFRRCTRCNACREVCPLCYCERCVQDKSIPQWVEKSPHARGNLAWNVTRAMHLGGRCVGCGACERACPAGIPLSLFSKKTRDIVAKSFGDKPNVDFAKPGPLTSYASNDDDSMFK